MRVIVAMSGGVDSSAAAALLVEAGYEVIGISLRLSQGEEERAPGRCCSPDDLEDARAVADHLGIPFYVFETSALFDEKVILPFISSYLGGETPIPCTACNREVKFGYLLEKARALGGKLATGHYARVEAGPSGYRLLQGVDASRDQSYFLHDLGQAELADLLFPIGGLTKVEAREVARRAGLHLADKAESQDICFVPDGDTARFVEKNASRVGATPQGGRVVSSTGEELGSHDGLHRFTIGQRRGLPRDLRNPAGDQGEKLPLYVSELRPETGELVVGGVAEVERLRFPVEQVRWVAGAAPSPEEELLVRVRHRHVGSPCRVEASQRGVIVHGLEPIRSPAPGQAAVFYRGEEVLGGGTIARERLPILPSGAQQAQPSS